MYKWIEAFVAWGVIYLGLWVYTGEWGLHGETWRAVVLVVCLIAAREGARWCGREDACRDIKAKLGDKL